MDLNNIKIEGELIAVIHHHWVTLLRPFFLLLMGWLAFLFVYFLALKLRQIDLLTGGILLLVDLVMLFLIHHFAFIFLFELGVTEIIVTTEQLIELKFLFMVMDDISSNEIEQIHSIEKEKHGIIKNIFNYGDILIYVAGKIKPVHLKYIANPTEFVTLLQTIKHKKPLGEIDFRSMRGERP